MKKTITMLGFVLVSTTSMLGQWTAVNTGLPALTTRGVANVSDTLMTAVKDKGIYYSVNNGDSWESWKFNSKLPNFNFNEIAGATTKTTDFTGTFLSIAGQSMLNFYDSNQKINIFNFSESSDQNINNWFNSSNSKAFYIGTKNNGIFYNPDHTGYIKSTGLTGGGLNVNNIFYLENRDKTEFTVAATDNGIFRTLDFGKTFEPFNPGFTNPIRVNQVGFFTLTENGIYFFSKETQEFSALKSTGDYRTVFMDMTTYSAYLFGNGVASKMNLQNFKIDELSINGITGGAITSATLVGDYIFVCTENGGVFRMAINNLGVGDFGLSNAAFNVSPNPSMGNFTIETDKPILVELIDLTGKLINTYRVDTSAQIDEKLSRGLYLLREKGTKNTKKLVIE